MKVQHRFLFSLKLCILVIMTLFMTINISAARVDVGIGVDVGPGYAYGPAYGPAYGSAGYAPPAAVYVPGHWYNGYWIPGQYVEQVGPQPGPGYVWFQGGFDSGHHWHNGHWGYRHRH